MWSKKFLILVATFRAVARELIRGAVYIHIFVLFRRISDEINRAEHEYMNIQPPSPINALATALATLPQKVLKKLKSSESKS